MSQTTEQKEGANIADPTSLGLLGLAVAALVLASIDFNWTENKKSLVIPWTLFLGATAQLIAGTIDFRRNNLFGATAFTGYALLWYGLTLTYAIALWGGVPFDLRHLTFAFIGYLIFSIYLTAGSLNTNKTLTIILICIDLALITLIVNSYAPFDSRIIGVTLFGTAFFSFYGAAAALLNKHIGFEVLPLGKPFTTFKP
jgi:succinate-acetate transporter protein